MLHALVHALILLFVQWFKVYLRTAIFKKHYSIRQLIYNLAKRVQSRHRSVDHERDCKTALVLKSIMAVEPIAANVVFCQLVAKGG